MSWWQTGPATDDATVAVRLHPLIQGLGENDEEQWRVEDFAHDLARYLVGQPRETLGPLARVVTVVAQRELRDARTLCRDRPLLAVESAARAVVSLWPWLRTPEPQAGDADPADEDDDGDADEDAPGDAAEALVVLGDLDPEAELDPEIVALAQRLTESLDGEGDGDVVEVGEAAASMLEGAGTPATTGAIEAERVASLLEQFAPGVGWSSAPGALERTLLDRLEQLVTLLDNIDKLKDLADQLGRMEEATTRKGPQDGGREEVAGVRLGGEISNVLPVELGLLGDGTTESLFYQRFLERRLMSLELSGTGDDGGAMGDKRGPVIACIDTSGSMEGDPELAAKALVLAVSRQVLPKGRVMHLLLFGGSAEFQEIRLRRGHGGLEGLLDFLAFSFRGGTDFDTPLLRAIELLEERDLNLADILVVTDGLCRANSHVVAQVAQAREHRGVRVWSVVLGREDTRGVDEFSDRVTAISL